MTIDYGFANISADVRSVVTIGSFDGVHSGHKVLLGALRRMAKRLGVESVVITFDPHPRIAMGRAEGMGLLTTIEERALLLEREGIDRMVVARFDENFRSQPYDAFVRESLVAKLGMVGMIVGYNHRFGHERDVAPDHYEQLALKYGFEVVRAAEYRFEGEKISSSVIRRLIAEGDTKQAEKLLGHKL